MRLLLNGGVCLWVFEETLTDSIIINVQTNSVFIVHSILHDKAMYHLSSSFYFSENNLLILDNDRGLFAR